MGLVFFMFPPRNSEYFLHDTMPKPLFQSSEKMKNGLDWPFSLKIPTENGIIIFC